MRKILLALLASLPLLFMPSCETDVDINSTWEEITIVYGLLDKGDNVHYFRINKAFLGGNVLEVAKIADSSYYQNQLQVVLEGYENGTLKQTIPFDTATISNKDTGFWYNPYMVVYKGTGQLNPGYQYKLYIKNTKSGKEIRGTTNLVQDFSIEAPPAGGKINFVYDQFINFKWKYAKNAIRYEPLIIFKYWEIPLGTSDTILKYMEWPQTIKFGENLTGEGEMQPVSVSSNGFYSTILTKLDQNFEGERLADSIFFYVSAAGPEYDAYLKVNEPSSSLVTERPEYTNIEGGFGFMSSRFQIVRGKRLHVDTESNLIDLNIGFVKNPHL